MVLIGKGGKRKGLDGGETEDGLPLFERKNRRPRRDHTECRESLEKGREPFGGLKAHHIRPEKKLPSIYREKKEDGLPSVRESRKKRRDAARGILGGRKSQSREFEKKSTLQREPVRRERGGTAAK